MVAGSFESQISHPWQDQGSSFVVRWDDPDGGPELSVCPPEHIRTPASMVIEKNFGPIACRCSMEKHACLPLGPSCNDVFPPVNKGGARMI